MKNPIEQLNKVFDSRVRLGIMSAVMVKNEVNFNELKEQEMMMQRITLATQMDPFVGKYFSTEYIRRKILMQTENEYKEIDKQMRFDIDTGLAIDPVQINMLSDLEQQNKAFEPELQSAEADAAADREMKKIAAAPKPSASKSDK